jgi:membrane protein
MANAAEIKADQWTIWRVVKQSFSEFSEDKCPRLGAALAYYTIFSIAPLLVIAIGVTGWILGKHQSDPANNPVVNQVQSLIGGEGGEAIKHMVTASMEKPKSGKIATIIGIVTLIFGASGVFGQLQDALNTIWEVAPKPGRGILGFIRDRFLSFTMVAGVCFMLLVSLVVSAGLSAMQHIVGAGGAIHYMWVALNFVISLVVVSGMFAMMFKVLPDVKMQWKDTLIGAVATAVLFGIGKWAIGMYLGKAGVSSTYGAAGSLVVLLLWVYYSSQIFLIGAEFTHVYSCHLGSQYKPDSNAISLTEAQRIHEGIPHERIISGKPANAEGSSPRKGRRAKAPEETPSRVLPVTVGIALGYVAAQMRQKPKAKKLVLAPGLRVTDRPRKGADVEPTIWRRFRKGWERGVKEAK